MSEETAVRALYTRLLDCWNERQAEQYAALFAEDGSIVGFDGSPVDGRGAIAQHIGGVFKDHQTARYVHKVREIRMLASDAALLRAVAGMIPPGKQDINPATNAIQSLIAVKQGDAWKIALFQNTPAQFHGRPEDAAALTEELRALV